MAAPTVSSYAFSQSASVLIIIVSEACTFGSAYAAGVIDYTDLAGTVWKNTAAIPAGNGGTTLVFTMARDYTATAETAETCDIAANTFKNGADEGNAAITNAAVFAPISEGTTGLIRDDITTLKSRIARIAAGTDVATDSPLTENLMDIDTKLMTYLLKTPRNEEKAWSVVDALNKYNQSSKSPQDLAALAFAIGELQAGLNPRGTFAMKPNGT